MYFVNYRMQVTFMVTVDGEKMSKSVGNVRQVADMLDKRSPNVIRMFCLGTHYSKNP